MSQAYMVSGVEFSYADFFHGERRSHRYYIFFVLRHVGAEH